MKRKRIDTDLLDEHIQATLDERAAKVERDSLETAQRIKDMISEGNFKIDKNGHLILLMWRWSSNFGEPNDYFITQHLKPLGYQVRHSFSWTFFLREYELEKHR